jgi:hypothetical protein
MNRPAITGSLVFAAAVALLAGGFFLGFNRSAGERGHPETAAKVFSSIRAYHPAGWEVMELPLGSTEAYTNLVKDTLSYDDVLQLRYGHGDRGFLLYVAYWRAGKVDLRTVGGHTPDSCWVYSGWEIAERQSGKPVYASPGLLAPGEYRCYTYQGVKQYVAFWHLLGGRPVAMWEKGMPTPGYLWQLLNGSRLGMGGEQYFIRISSARPLKEFWDDPVLQQILAFLGPSGLLTQSDPVRTGAAP